MKFCLMITAMLAMGCTAAQLDTVQDASNKRDVICRFVKIWKQDHAELQKLDELCDAGAELKEIAAAYAGCPVEAADEAEPRD